MMTVGAIAVGALAATVLALSVGTFGLLDGSADDIVDGSLAEVASIDILGANDEAVAETQGTTQDSVQDATGADESASVLELPTTQGNNGDNLELFSENAEMSETLTAFGVFADQRPSRRLASFVAYEGHILTSASAIAGRSSVWLRSAGSWIQATVLGADPYSDVAVLQPDEWLPEFNETLIAMAEDLALGVPKGVGVTLNLPIDLEATQDQDVGVVINGDESVIASTGFEIHHAIVTTMLATPEHLGAAVLNDQGDGLGMVIDANSTVTAAIPLNLAVAVAESYHLYGNASGSWLGVEAMADDNNEVRLVHVDPSGPASGLLVTDDVIDSVNGEELHNVDHLVHMTRAAGVGGELHFMVRRGQTLMPVDVAVAQLPNR